jgi:hypothetical protein
MQLDGSTPDAYRKCRLQRQGHVPNFGYFFEFVNTGRHFGTYFPVRRRVEWAKTSSLQIPTIATHLR